MKKRSWFQRGDVLVLAAILLIGVVALLWQAPMGQIARISYNGISVRVLDLAHTPEGVFTLQEQPAVSFEVKAGKIRFVAVDCPDKRCEAYGYLTALSQVAICLPNRVSLQIVSGDETLDAIVG